MEEDKEHAKLNEKLWDLRAGKFYDRFSSYFRFMQKRLVSLLDLKDNQRLLDLGCGPGWAVCYAAGLINDRGEFYGIDISSKMIEKAKANTSAYKNVHFYHTAADQLPFESDFFDFIICSNSFHHYFNPGKVLSEVYRVLKFKGRIYIMDHTGDRFVIRMVDRWAKKIEPEHVKLYSTREYRTLFAEAGLDYVASKSVPFLAKIQIGEKRYQQN